MSSSGSHHQQHPEGGISASLGMSTEATPQQQLEEDAAAAAAAAADASAASEAQPQHDERAEEDPSEHELVPTIRCMPVESARRICAGQAVFDLASCAKELMDNALDAGSQSINIRLFNKGLDIVEVSDDGSGVPMKSRPSLALPHATSKISTFDDIYNASNSHNMTLGFRGEALYSLANLSTQLVIATRCQSDSMAQKMEFNRDGTLNVDTITNLPRKVGTTVAVVGLLAALPVRRRDLERRIQQHRSKLVQCVLGYAVFSTGVRIHLMDIVVSKQQSTTQEKTILATACHSHTLRDTVSSVLGPKFLAGMVDIEIDLTEIFADASSSSSTLPHQSPSPSWKITGLITSLAAKNKKKASFAAASASAAARTAHHQLFALHRRPVDLPPVARLLKECFRAFGQDRAPSCVLQFHLPNNAYDINLSPDKRQVLWTHEAQILRALQTAVTELWARETDGQFQPGDALTAASSNLTQPSIRRSSATQQEDDLDDNADGGGDASGNASGNASTSAGSAGGNNNDDAMGDSSSGSRLFDRRYAFVHDPTTSTVREQSDHQRRIEYERSSPDRTMSQRCKRRRSSHPPDRDRPSSLTATASEDYTETVPTFIAGMSQGTETVRGAGSASPSETEDGNESFQKQQPQQQKPRSAKRLRIHVDHGNKEDDRATKNSFSACTSTTANNNTTIEVTPSPAGHHTPPSVGFSSSAAGVAPVTTRENQSNNGGSSYSEHEKIHSHATGTVAAATRASAIASEVGMSPQEKKHWREVQAKFNRFSSDDDDDVENEESTSSSPLHAEECSSPEAADVAPKMATNLARFRAASSTTTTTNGKASASQKSYGLERFGFRAIAKEDANNTTSASCTTGMSSKSNSRNCKTTTTTQQQQQQQRATAPKAASRVVSREKVETKDSSSARTCSRRPAAERENTASTTWNSFGTTNEVILASMRDRMAQRDRKQKHRELASVEDVAASSVEDEVGAAAAAAAGQSPDDDDNKATTVSLNKEDFRNMTVIGQFNMGFILARSENGNLWILDQHASDEKFNFEKLCNETVLHEQQLIQPMPLELSPSEEACVLDHMDIFQKNGFRFKYDEEKPPRQRLSLIALPHSGARDGRKAVQYGKDDVLALCAILGGGDDNYDDDAAESGGTGTDGSGMYGNNAVRRYASGNHGMNADKIIARLPKSIAMFASRACRGSIMIGTALSDNEMTKVVQKLAEVDHPWNCPHGRPTMRHIGDLRPLLKEDDKRAAEHIAGPTVTAMSQDVACEDDE